MYSYMSGVDIIIWRIELDETLCEGYSKKTYFLDSSVPPPSTKNPNLFSEYRNISHTQPVSY